MQGVGLVGMEGPLELAIAATTCRQAPSGTYSAWVVRIPSTLYGRFSSGM